MPARKKSNPKAPAARAPRRATGVALAQARARLDEKRAQRRARELWAHYWLLCPKCGGDMFVQRAAGITFEVCRDCHNLAIDAAEIALLLDHTEPAKALRAILKKSRKPDTTEI